MIKVYVDRNSHRKIAKIIVRGHAGYDEIGKDIVCAAVSAIAYTCAGALKTLLDLNEEPCIIKDGYMECFLPDGLSEKQNEIAAYVFETVLVGFKQIAHSYDRYIKVFEQEV
jgi:hypothetical protein